MEKKSCPGCGGMFTPVTGGGLRTHGPVGDRCDQEARTAPTPVQCFEPKCTCGGDGGPEHELAIAGAFDDQVEYEGPATVTDAAHDKKIYRGEKGPWFGAMYDGRCSVSECAIYEGDRIRADGKGGYECEDCGSFDGGMDDHVRTSLGIEPTYQEQASAAAKRHLAANAADTPYVALLKDELRDQAGETLTHFDSGVRFPNTPAVELRVPAEPGPMPTPEEFMDFEDPTSPAEKPRRINVSGQPEAERDWLKRYIVRDPDTGDFRWMKNGKKAGITRVTTFNKAAQDSKAINDWGKRNVVIGAYLRPDILRRAHGLVHEGGRDQLDRIVQELDTAAGGKVSADEGIFLHEETEKIDAGLQSWMASPAAYRADLKRYLEALAEAGLEPVRGLIERTTMISEFGGVCGTFDRIFYHRSSGSYVIGDLKTGKTMKYAMDETQTQLWCYAHGVNTNGIYDWNTNTWGTVGDPMTQGSHPDGTPVRVREDVGVIIHMPVQGPEAGTVNVLLADLEAGKAHAELCHQIRSRPKQKPVPWASWVAPVPTWFERFAAVRSGEEATALWREAKAEGWSGPALNALVAIGREALADKG